jgi:hypothetical protein
MQLWHIQFEHSSLKETRKARKTNTMQHIRREGSPRFKSCLQTSCTMCDFRLLPKSRWELPSSGLLCSEWWWFLTDISGHPISPIFRGQESSNKQVSSTVYENNRNTSIITLVDSKLNAQNSYLFKYNTFIKILYMFRALPCLSSGGLCHNCIHAASGIVTLCRWLSCAPAEKELPTSAKDSHLQRVTIPEAAYIQIWRRPPEDKQGNARNM